MEVTLTDRTDMGVAMLLGRASLGARLPRSSDEDQHPLAAETQDTMKIALLTRNPKLYSHQRLIETAEQRGHEMVPIDYLRCYMNITSQEAGAALSGREARGLRRGDPAHRRLAHLLRHSRCCGSSR